VHDPARPEVYRMTRVTFGVNESVFLSIQTVHHHARQYASSHPVASAEVLMNTYVDDTTTGTETETDAVTLRRDIQTMMAAGGFRYHKWVSNSQVVMASIPEDLRAPPALVKLGDADLETEEVLQKTLGVQWDPKTDEICFYGFDFEVPAILTKREISSIAARIFDPTGLISPVLIVAKLILRESWNSKDDWDKPVEPDLERAFRQWCAELKALKRIRIPRWVGTCKDVIDIQFHGFSDASTKAFAAAVYIRIVYADGVTRVALLM